MILFKSGFRICKEHKWGGGNINKSRNQFFKNNQAVFCCELGLLESWLYIWSFNYFVWYRKMG